MQSPVSHTNFNRWTPAFVAIVTGGFRWRAMASPLRLIFPSRATLVPRARAFSVSGDSILRADQKDRGF